MRPAASPLRPAALGVGQSCDFGASCVGRADASDALLFGQQMPINSSNNFRHLPISRAKIMSRSLFITGLLFLVSLVGSAQSQHSLETAGAGFDNEHNEAESRVFGGNDAKFQRYPYMAHIYNKAGQPYCAGTLVTPNYILSAAHCADDDSTPAYVIIGKHSRLYYQKEPGVERIDVKRVITHPDHRDGFDWINDHLMNDIVLLELKASSRHTPVKLSFDANRLKAGTGLRVMGWGTTSYDRTRPEELQIADVDYIPNSVCEKSKGKIRPTSTYDKTYEGYVTDDMMCAARSGKDACSGDSGGPLIIPGNSPAQDLQVGIVSWGYGCASANFPGICKSIDEILLLLESLL